MLRTMLRSKIHRCRITEANLYYEGSITIDEKLMRAADIVEYEKVEVFNMNNGHRIETYAIKGKAGSGIICMNGAAARGACVGDQIIIVAYVLCDDKALANIKPKIIKVDERNRVKN